MTRPWEEITSLLWSIFPKHTAAGNADLPKAETKILGTNELVLLKRQLVEPGFSVLSTTDQ